MIYTCINMLENMAGPVLIYFLAAQVVDFIGEGWLHIQDAAALTSTTAVLTLPLFVWMCRRDRARFGEGSDRGLSGKDVVFLVAFALLCNLMFTFLVNLLFSVIPGEVSNEAQERLFGSALFFQAAGLGLIVPAAEEVLFRGLVYRRLKRYTKQCMNAVWPAILGASAVFALVHGNLIQIAFAFPMGIILAALCERYGTIAAPIVFHITVNLSSVFASAIL